MAQSSGAGESNSAESKPRSIDDHDWHSAEYVGDWLRRDEARKPVLRWKPPAPAQAAE